MKNLTSIANRRRLTRATLMLSVLVLVLTLTAACSQNDELGAMPPFSLSAAADGSTIDSRDFQGQAMLVSFFATWCPPCRQEASTLVALQNKYGKDNFTVVGISVDQDSRDVRGFISALNINYPVAMSAADTPRNFGNVVGVPTSFLIDTEGNIVQRFDGYVEIQVLEQALQNILG